MSQDSSERDLPRQAGDDPDDTHADGPEYEISEQPSRALGVIAVGGRECLAIRAQCASQRRPHVQPPGAGCGAQPS